MTTMPATSGLGTPATPTGATACGYDCKATLCELWNAIVALGSGKQRVNVRYDNRSVQYSNTQLSELKQIYQRVWDDCGADSGLPSLRAERGRPARVCIR